MFKRLGEIIEKKSWLVVLLVLIVTIGFSYFIPQIEMKTEFSDFMPEEEIVQANTKIGDYFGTKNPVMFAYIKTQTEESTLSTNALKEIYYIQNKTSEIKEVVNTISLNTFLDQICLLEYQKTIDKCTPEEIQTVIDDIFIESEKEIRILEENDENEEIDYKTFKLFGKGKSIDSIDIKNAQASYDNNNINFSIEVQDLSTLEENFKPPIPLVNIIEWYIDFDNLIKFDQDLDIDYKIAAHIEPKNPIWTIGNGVIKNIQDIITQIKNQELFNTFQKQAYLWIKPPGQNMYFPITLKTGEIKLDREKNTVEIKISREEIGRYGIATKMGSFELPSKLSDFQVGTRYYKSSFLNLPWLRISANTSSLLNTIEKIQDKTIIGPIAEKILKKTANLSFEDLNEFIEDIDKNLEIPDKIALKDMEKSWVIADKAPDTEPSKKILFIKPSLFDDLKLNLKGFLSNDFSIKKGAKSSLMLIEINSTTDFEDIVDTNKKVIDTVGDLDGKYDYVSLQITGDGVISAEINELASEVNQFLGPLIFVIILVILFISFRRPSFVILPMLTLLVATIWLFGTMVIIGIPFNVMYVALIPLIMGLGVDYSVHLFHNYRVEIEQGKEVSEAIKNSVKDIGNAMFLAMITTVIAFMSFLTATVPPIRNLGLLLGLGVAYTFITTITLLPSLRYILDKRKKDIKRKISRLKKVDVSYVMGRISKFVIKNQKKIIIVMLVFTIFFAYQATMIDTGFNFQDFAPEDTESIELFEVIGKDFPYSTENEERILLEGNVATVQFLKGIYNTHQNLKDDTYIARKPDGSLKVTSIYSLIQLGIENNESIIEKFNLDPKTGIPANNQDVKALFDYYYKKSMIQTQGFDIENFDMENIENMETPEFEIDAVSSQIRNVLYRDDSGRYKASVIRVYIDPSIQDSGGDLNDNIKILKEELDNDLVDYGGPEATVTGQLIITFTITNSLSESQSISTAISIVFATIVLIIAYRNPFLGLIAIIPVGITMIWILGTMSLIGYTLNTLTITITSITIGIGIDYAIHATERFRLVADKTGDISKAMYETISHTGGALLIAALTTAFGFGVLAFAPIPPQQQFGIILAITIAYAFVTSILILPFVLVRWARWRKKRKGYIVTTNGMKKVNGKWVKKEDIKEK